MEAFLRAFLPKLLGDQQFNIYPFQDKGQLLTRLPNRLKGYAKWIPEGHRIVVIVDQDDEACDQLKAQLEQMASDAALFTRSRRDSNNVFTVINRIAIEELEAWYFGDWEAVRRAYPRVSATVPQQAAYRDPDAIRGGTWERFEQLLQRSGYFKSGLRKIEAAQAIGIHVEPARNRSRSFQHLRDALLELTEEA